MKKKNNVDSKNSDSDSIERIIERLQQVNEHNVRSKSNKLGGKILLVIILGLIGLVINVHRLTRFTHHQDQTPKINYSSTCTKSVEGVVIQQFRNNQLTSETIISDSISYDSKSKQPTVSPLITGTFKIKRTDENLRVSEYLPNHYDVLITDLPNKILIRQEIDQPCFQLITSTLAINS
ncbi:MAG: hypothetical protein HWE27_09110 [Gammaproteobacteria bacterium]|nr:hypothetical protein [Gammaproteobacteria bacterium]